MTVTIDKKARPLARATGIDKLGQSTLAKLDANGDGVVGLRDVQRLAKTAGLEKDGVLSRDDRAKIAAALSEGASSSTRSAGASSALAARAGGGAKKLEGVYMRATLSATRDGLRVDASTTLYDAAGRDKVGEKDRAATLAGLRPVAADVEYYGEDGGVGLPNASGRGGGALYTGSAYGGGFLAAVADAKRGVVLVDVAGRAFAEGGAPAVHDVLSPTDLAKDAAVKAAAKKAGLDPRALSVDVVGVHLSAGFRDGRTLTLALDATLKDAKGRSADVELSTTLHGDLKKSVAKLSRAPLEEGVRRSAGWLYPPSVDADRPALRGSPAETPSRNGDVARRLGGGEAAAPVRPRVGGGESGSTWRPSPSVGGRE